MLWLLPPAEKWDEPQTPRLGLCWLMPTHVTKSTTTSRRFLWRVGNWINSSKKYRRRQQISLQKSLCRLNSQINALIQKALCCYWYSEAFKGGLVHSARDSGCSDVPA